MLLTLIPIFTHRWVYCMSNLQVAAQADQVCQLIVRAHKAGYNGIVIADSKLQRLDQVPDFYFTNAKKVIACANQNQMEIVPCVWPIGYAAAMLSHDPNLIEGLPVKDAPFVVYGAEARPASGDQNLLSNGGFESATGDKIAGATFQDEPGKATFLDNDAHTGVHSVRMENAKGANARVVFSIKVQPYHQYLLSGWSKRDGVKGYVQAIALDSKGRNLVVSEFPQPASEPWTEFRYGFNSLENTEVKIYVGVWGGTAGKLWFDDLAVRDAGLLNVLHRPGAPVKVSLNDTSLTEGKDFAPITDPNLGNKPWPGEYEVDHAPPAIKLLPGGRAKEGDTLLVSYYHAKTGIINQSSICISEPKTQELMRDEAKRVADLFHPKGLFWSHDEIRIGGWCKACEDRKLTPGQMLAENARQCDQIQQELLPGSTPYVWSDMFDPAHNAVDNYYLTHGTLAGAWEGIPKNAVIVNWNSGQQLKSLSFFAQRGHKQILAGFYDGPVESIKPWMDEALKTNSLDGVMYTTWVGDYSKLEAFARAAWGK